LSHYGSLQSPLQKHSPFQLRGCGPGPAVPLATYFRVASHAWGVCLGLSTLRLLEAGEQRGIVEARQLQDPPVRQLSTRHPLTVRAGAQWLYVPREGHDQLVNVLVP
jgi:hypothetical protein